MSATTMSPVAGPSWPSTPAKPSSLFEQELLAGDYYEVLRIGPRADEETIERVYRTLAERFHTDNPTTGDADAYMRVTQAYETLSDPARRMEYDDNRERNLKS